MKTSLVCLLLLAAVVCAAPQAKQTRKARFLQEVNKAKLHERVKKAKLLQEAEEARISNEPEENAVVDIKTDVEGAAEARSYCLEFRGPCYGPHGEPGCVYDYCNTYPLYFDYVDYYDSSIGCYCCYEPHPCYYY